MHTVRSSPASRALRTYIRAYAQREVLCSGHDIVQPIPASLEHVVQFDFHDSPLIEYSDGTVTSAYGISVVGPHTMPGASLRLRGKVESFAIFFQPLGFWQLFRVPMPELTNRFYEGGDLLGPGVYELRDRMAKRSTFAARVRVAEEYLLQQVAGARPRTLIMSSAESMFHNRGLVRVEHLAHGLDLSVRQFERRFVNELGITPKLFARITRFQMALDAKVLLPARSWLSIAHEFGYCDQMHMVRDFQMLSGVSPSQTIAQLGDTRPSALVRSRQR